MNPAAQQEASSEVSSDQRASDNISLARALQKRGEWQRAISILEAVVCDHPHRHEAWHTLGDLFRTQKLWHEAENAYWETAERVPDTWQCWYSLIVLHLERPPETRAPENTLVSYVAAHQAAVSLVNHHDAAFNLKMKADPYRLLFDVLFRAAQLEGLSPEIQELRLRFSLETSQRWLEADPVAAAYASVAHCLHLQKRFLETIPYWENALAQDGKNGQWRAYYALALTHQNHRAAFESARVEYERAIADDPSLHVAMSNLSFTCGTLGDPESARYWIKRAIEVAPAHAGHRFKQACFDLQDGKLEEGFAGYEYRMQIYEPDSIKYTNIFRFRDGGVPLWDGSDLKGRRLFVHPEQGFGDFLMMMRLLPLLLKRGASQVRFFCYPSMDTLTEALPLPPEVSSVREIGFADMDCYTPIMTLPHFLGIRSFADIPPPLIPIIPGELVSRWHSRLQGNENTRIGVTWRGSDLHEVNRWRSIGMEEFITGVIRPLIHLGFSVVSLQLDATPEELAPLQALGVDTQAIAASADWLDSAALVSLMTAVVGVDTAVMHLAGTLNIPVVMLNRHVALSDWRWLRGRADSPWYPSVHIVWQSEPGIWRDVMPAAIHKLETLLSSRQKSFIRPAIPHKKSPE